MPTRSHENTRVDLYLQYDLFDVQVAVFSFSVFDYRASIGCVTLHMYVCVDFYSAPFYSVIW